MNIDFHNHFYPKGYMDELSRGEGYARVETDDQGRLLVHTRETTTSWWAPTSSSRTG